MQKQLQPIKLAELSGLDWTKGISIHPSIQVGGVFKTASNFDPFELLGYMQPSPAASVCGTVTSTPLFQTIVNESGTLYNYSHGTTKLYKTAVLTGTTTDITTSSAITTGSVQGAIIWRGKYIYATDTAIIALTVGTSTNTSLLTGLNTCAHIMCIGQDGYLYITNGNSIARCILDTGTTGNSTAVFTPEVGSYSSSTSLTITDLLNDGRFLVYCASRTSGSCVIGFWNMAAGFNEITYNESSFIDSGLIGMEYMDGGVYVFGTNNFWLCSVSTPPKVVFPFNGNSNITAKPNSPSQIGKHKGRIVWATSTSGLVYGFGNLVPGQAKVFFQPYTSTSGLNTSLVSSGTTLFTGTDLPAVYSHSSATKNSSAIRLANSTFESPAKLAFVKVTLKDKLATGQSIEIQGQSLDGNGVVINDTIISYSTANAKQSFLIYPQPAGSANDVEYFNELSTLYILTTGNAVIQSLQIWGYPEPVTNVS